jgi:membrane associated rhomboid family serine protease
MSTAMKALIGANVVIFLAQGLMPSLTLTLGLVPARVLGGLQIWRLVSYMFLHSDTFHILFNMLALWMIGTELEHRWGTRYFLKFYFVTGVGAGVLTVLLSLLPFDVASQLYHGIVIGASGAIYGLLLAYGLYYPERLIYYIVFPIPAKYFVLLIGIISFYGSMSGSNGVANATHLGGLLVAYLLLKGARVHPVGELKYRYLKWRIDRARKKFGVYSGGRTDHWDRRVH